MTLADLIETLGAQPSDTRLVFEAPDGPVRPGYHLTEFRHAAMTGFACDGVKESWEEASVQLMDGWGGSYMTADRFLNIATKTVREMPELADIPLQVEFGSKNVSRALYELGAPHIEDGRVTLVLKNSAVACKAMTTRATTGCSPKSRCC